MDTYTILLLLIFVGLFIAGYFFSPPEAFSKESNAARERAMQEESDMSRGNSLGGDHVGPAESGDWDGVHFSRPVREDVSSYHQL